MRILLTGAEGRVGRHLATTLAAAGHTLRTFDMTPPAVPGGEAVVADLLDLDEVRRATDGVQAIVHAAAIPTDVGDGSTVMATNVMGTWNVLQAAVESRVPRVVAFSSINAQGSVGGHRPPPWLPLDDTLPHHPSTPYQLSKHLGEEICRATSERHGMVTLCLRPVWVTDDHDYDGGWFGGEAFMDEWRPELWAYVDIRDVADAADRALAVQGVLHDRFLLAAADTSATIPTATLVERHYAAIPWSRPRVTLEAEGGPFHGLIDCNHARAVLGWTPRRSWRDQHPVDRPTTEA